MTNSHQKLLLPVLLAFATIAIFPIAFAGQFNVPAQTRGTLPVPAGTPAAVIKRIMPVNPGVAFQATVSRGAGSTSAVTGFLLYVGDVIETENAKVTVVFLDEPYSERDNEVIIEANSRVGISSTYSWWGTVWAKVKGAFNSKTTYARAGASGTEYQFTVVNPTHSLIPPDNSTLVVLEGSVEVTKRPFEFTSRVFERRSPALETELPRFLFASFLSKSAAQGQFARTLDVPAGQVTLFEPTYHLHNDCKLPHRIEFRTSDNTDWLRLEGTRAVDIDGGANLPVSLKLSIDATRLSGGRHEAHVYAVCVDCNREAQCPEQQLDYLLSVNVTGPPPTPSPSPTISPTPLASPVPNDFTVRALEQSAITRGFDQPSPAPTPQIQAVLSWTNQVLLNGQPSYSAQNLIPHFATVPERSQNFVTARERAILANDPGSHATLGDVYSDWGQGAWATFAYEKEIKSPSGARATISVDLAEAYRLSGRLGDALQVSTSFLADKSAKAQNLFGNIALDQAVIALDGGRTQEATTRIEDAKRFYAAASGQASISPTTTGPASDTVQTNLAEANIVGGNVALQNNTAPEAKTRFADAARLLETTQRGASIYPFPITDLGVAYRGLGDAAVLAGDSPDTFYANAKRQHDQAIAAHRDFAEAYLNLGDLFEDQGDLVNAEANYRLAIQFRPELPDAYYPLAMLLQDKDRDLAAALAATYLKLKPEVFLRGQKGDNARKLANHNSVPRPKRIGEKPKPSSVPNVVSQTQAEATRMITAAGFKVGRRESRVSNGPVDIVLQQNPAGGVTAAPGSVIDIVVSAIGTDVTVPDVVNKNQAAATAAIQDAGLQIGKVELRRDNKKPRDIVVSQRPNAGRTVKRGSSVDIVVWATRPVEVPEVIDDKQPTAIRKITEKGLVVGKVDQRESCKVGEVIETTPGPHTPVDPGSTVDLVVGWLGENPVRVPNFVGRSRYDVEAEIRQERFTFGSVRPEESDQPEGTVIGQSPRAETQFARSCAFKIDIVVAIPLRVGNYVGQTERVARFQVSMKGFSANVEYRETRDQRNGIVLEQTPPPGSPASRGMVITLIVSRVPTVPVPKVEGLLLVQGMKALENAQLRLGRVIPESPGRGSTNLRGFPSPCTIWKQDPVENQQVPIGTPVNVWIVPGLNDGVPIDCTRYFGDR